MTPAPAWRAQAKRGVEGARALWEGFWFAPESPRNLAAARVIFAAQALWILLSRDVPALSALPAVFYAEVPASARWRYLIWEGHPGFERGLQTVAVLALLGVLLGVGARVCSLVAGLLLYHLAPLETLFFTPSPWSKGLTLPVLGLLTLALSRCGDALSLRKPRDAQVPPGGEYGWPLRLLQLFVCQPYLLSGYAKLHETGWRWASPEHIRRWLLLSNLDDQLSFFRAPGLWIAERPLLCLAMGIAALAFDFGFIAVLFSKRARLALIPAAFVFHLAIMVTQNYAFLAAPLLLVFVDWGGWGRRLEIPA